MSKATIKLITAASTNASAVGDSYTYGNFPGCSISWGNSVDNCDSDGEGRVFLTIGADTPEALDETLDFLIKEIRGDDQVSDFDIDYEDDEVDAEAN